MEGLFCYPVRAWEDYSWRGHDPSCYWSSGIPLSEWDGTHRDPRDWEILFAPKDIITTRRVSRKRLLGVLEGYDREEMSLLLRRHRIR